MLSSDIHGSTTIWFYLVERCARAAKITQLRARTISRTGSRSDFCDLVNGRQLIQNLPAFLQQQQLVQRPLPLHRQHAGIAVISIEQSSAGSRFY